MALYKLRMAKDDLSSGILERAKHEDVDYEKYFEDWLENSPDALLDEEGTVLWIGRQVKANVGDTGKYPDLLGVDSVGDVIIVELKKGKAPRDVIAQILEYATWASSLDSNQLNEIAVNYFSLQDRGYESFPQAHKEVFYPDSEEEPNVKFNENQKLFIIAEEIPSIIRQVTAYLRNKHHINIFCIEYEILKSEQGEYFISTEKIGVFEDIGPTTTRWNEPVRVKTVIYEAVNRVTNGRNDSVFSPTDVYKELIKTYPDINRSSVSGQIIQDCVNHSSRKHYPSGQQDFYFRIDKGKFRLYDSSKDGKWDSKGEKIENLETG